METSFSFFFSKFGHFNLGAWGLCEYVSHWSWRYPVNQRPSFTLVAFPTLPPFLSSLHRRLLISLLLIAKSRHALGISVSRYEIELIVLDTLSLGMKILWLGKAWSRTEIVDSRLGTIAFEPSHQHIHHWVSLWSSSSKLLTRCQSTVAWFSIPVKERARIGLRKEWWVFLGSLARISWEMQRTTKLQTM